MLLSVKEMKQSKGKYAMIFTVIVLIAYLVFFLTGLAYGLAQAGREAADKWNASAVVMTKEADNSLSISNFETNVLPNIKAKDKAPLAESGSIMSKNGKAKTTISLFGVDAKSFIAPNIIKGHQMKNDNEIVVNDSLAKDEGYHIGDKVNFAGSDQTYTIVGMTDHAKFSVAPVVYMSIESLNQLRYGSTMRNNQINAVVVRDVKHTPKNLEAISMKDFINNLPGYSAQVMTFTFMIGALMIIAAVVLGIFIFVLTLHKKKTIGIMKIQGIPTRLIAKSVAGQTFFLATGGVLLGLGLTLLSALFLPSSMPFQLNIMLNLSVAIVMIVITMLASIFSIRSIVKIDPLTAMNMGDE